jgi:hypothetical protein
MSGRRIELTPASEITPRHVSWLWHHRIPIRTLTLAAGEPGLAKSILTGAWLTAQITRGTLEGALEGRPADVLIASAEDDWEAPLVPRLMAVHADLARVHRMVVVDDEGRCTLTLPDDAGRIARKVEELARAGRKVAMVIVDPIGSFLSSATDSHRDASVRRALAPIADLAAEWDLAALAVMHLTKDEQRRLLSRVSGSIGFVGAARSVLTVVRDPDDPDGEQGYERLLVHPKSNWGPLTRTRSAVIEIRAVEIAEDDPEREPVGVWVDRGESGVTVDDLQTRDDDLDAVRDAILASLSAGERDSLAIKEEVAGRLRVATRTVERRARRMERAGELRRVVRGSPPKAFWGPLATPSRAQSELSLLTLMDSDNSDNSDARARTREAGEDG